MIFWCSLTLFHDLMCSETDYPQEKVNLHQTTGIPNPSSLILLLPSGWSFTRGLPLILTSMKTLIAFNLTEFFKRALTSVATKKRQNKAYIHNPLSMKGWLNWAARLQRPCEPMNDWERESQNDNVLEESLSRKYLPMNVSILLAASSCSSRIIRNRW